MKALLFLLLFVAEAKAQKISENKVDEFTKHAVKRTSWDAFAKGSNFYGYSRLSKIDDTYFLDLKFMSGGSIFSITKGASLMLKTKSDSIITLKTTEYQITCKGCGAINLIGSNAEGINVNFVISKLEVEYILKNPVIKIRIYTTDGYIEQEIKEKFSEVFENQLRLIIE